MKNKKKSCTLFLGENSEHLIKLITNQIKFDRNLSIESLYTEIINQLETYNGKFIVSNNDANFKVNPKKIEKTNNFQFLINDEMVAISNKYF